MTMLFLCDLNCICLAHTGVLMQMKDFYIKNLHFQLANYRRTYDHCERNTCNTRKRPSLSLPVRVNKGKNSVSVVPISDLSDCHRR